MCVIYNVVAFLRMHSTYAWSSTTLISLFATYNETKRDLKRLGLIWVGLSVYQVQQWNNTYFIFNFEHWKLIPKYFFTLTDNEILGVLNNGTIKELKKLQGVGQKRAKLIIDWRKIYGPFQQVNFSQKWKDGFLLKWSLFW